MAGGSLDLDLRYLKADLVFFYDRRRVPLSLRFGDITTGMYGGRRNHILKTKAAETAQLLPFAIELARARAKAIPSAPELRRSGDALARDLATLREAPARVPHTCQQALTHLCIRGAKACGGRCAAPRWRTLIVATSRSPRRSPH